MVGVPTPPNNAKIFRLSISSLAATTAESGSYLSSTNTSLIFVPLIPLASLAAEKAANSPRQTSTPRPAEGPLKADLSPSTINSSAWLHPAQQIRKIAALNPRGRPRIIRLHSVTSPLDPQLRL